MHKRFDPIYVDARDRIRKMGGFGYMYGQRVRACVRARVRACVCVRACVRAPARVRACMCVRVCGLSARVHSCGGMAWHRYAYMSQPKHQLETFRAWAGAHWATPYIHKP